MAYIFEYMGIGGNNLCFRLDLAVLILWEVAEAPKCQVELSHLARECVWSIAFCGDHVRVLSQLPPINELI